MNLAIFYDTETTGIPLFDQPSEDPMQPHIVQLAAAMVDLDSEKTLQTIDLIVRPDGWVIEPEMSAIHGITHEMAMDVGISEIKAIEVLMDMVGQRVRIGHNEPFDARITRIAIKRYLHDDELADQWKAGRSECTAKMATKIVNLPPTEKMLAAGRRQPKTPSLTEAYRHFFGKDFDNAHSAISDVLACRDVYFAMKKAA